MIITLSGPPGSGTSTVGKEIAKRLGIRYVPIGEIFRKMAKEKGMDLDTFNRYAETNPNFDKEVDIKQAEEAREGGVVLDSRLSGWLVRKADLRIFLKAPLDVRIKRVAQRDKTSEEKALIEIKIREESEKKRYKEYYNIDIDNLGIYDLVIDTTRWNAEEVAEIIHKAVGNKS